jgi:hypothetical protein
LCTEGERRGAPPTRASNARVVTALAVDATYVKALHRRALAREKLEGLEHLSGALDGCSAHAVGGVVVWPRRLMQPGATDYKRVVELEPGNAAAQAKVAVLTPRVEEERQKQMQEMLGLCCACALEPPPWRLRRGGGGGRAGKLKDLGNLVLGKFGLSTDNFKMEKDPSTGSYSVSFAK